jgi:hypothetical protein
MGIAKTRLIFRLEKLASSLGEPCCVTETANEKFRALVETRLLGEFELKCFDEKRASFAL